MQLDPNYLITDTAQLREVIPSPHEKIEQKVKSRLTDEFSAFIGRSALVFVGTVDAAGGVDVSPKGDAPGFVEVVDDQTLLMPDRSGNRLAFGFENLIETGQISLIFLVAGVRETLRVTGRVQISRDPELCRRCAADGKPATLVSVIRVDEAFFHCGKALVRAKLWRSAAERAAEEALVHRHFAADHGVDEQTVAADLEAYYQAD